MTEKYFCITTNTKLYDLYSSYNLFTSLYFTCIVYNNNVQIKKVLFTTEVINIANFYKFT